MLVGGRMGIGGTGMGDSRSRRGLRVGLMGGDILTMGMGGKNTLTGSSGSADQFVLGGDDVMEGMLYMAGLTTL